MFWCYIKDDGILQLGIDYITFLHVGQHGMWSLMTVVATACVGMQALFGIHHDGDYQGKITVVVAFPWTIKSTHHSQSVGHDSYFFADCVI